MAELDRKRRLPYVLIGGRAIYGTFASEPSPLAMAQAARALLYFSQLCVQELWFQAHGSIAVARSSSKAEDIPDVGRLVVLGLPFSRIPKTPVGRPKTPVDRLPKGKGRKVRKAPKRKRTKLPEKLTRGTSVFFSKSSARGRAESMCNFVKMQRPACNRLFVEPVPSHADVRSRKGGSSAYCTSRTRMAGRS